MNTRRILLSVLASSLMAAPLFAATRIGPGKYMLSVSPQFDEQTADRMEKGLDSIKQLTSIDAKPADSTLHFQVKENTSVDLAQIKSAVEAAAPAAQVGDPVPEPKHTMGSSGSQSDLPSTGAY